MRLAMFLLLPLIAFAQTATTTAVPDGTIPVVFLNGYQFGCTSSSFNGNFGSADTVLKASNLISLYFDNCSVPNNPSIETLGAAFGKYLATLRYANGSTVPQVDVVAHSMGGLIVRAYLSGKQNGAVFNPPVVTGIRKAVFIATPHFGTYLATYLGTDIQTNEMALGSQFLFDLNTWNQGTDDLRGVDVLAIAGNGGTGFESILSGSNLSGFDDGVVTLTSASAGFAIPGRTRVVPACHTSDSLVFSAGVCFSSTPAINAINDASNVVGQIITSFLTGSSAWTGLGTAIETNAVGSTTSGLLMATQDLNGVTGNLTSATAGGTALGTNALVAYREALPANTSLSLIANLLGSVSISAAARLTAGTSSAITVKPGPSITGVVPAGIAQFPRNVAPGAFVTVYGANLTSLTQQQSQPYPTQLGDVIVLVNGAPAPVQYISPTQINFIYPNLPPGLTKLTVKSALGQQTVNVLLASAVPSIFTFTGVANGPAAAENAVSGALVGANASLHAGDYVALFLTGIGQTPANTTVTVGGQNCAGQYFFAGHVASYVGLDQVNCQIPAGVAGAAVPVVITTNGRASNTATLSIQ